MPRVYALLLEAQVAATSRGADAPERLRQLDSALADPVWVPWASYGNLVAARLHQERGEIPATLAAVRRRAVGMGSFPHYVKYLREEGRLAALTGDREGAIRAYRHYLALRGDASLGYSRKCGGCVRSSRRLSGSRPTAEGRHGGDLLGIESLLLGPG
jgi:hypothetical protein